jgi:hypothetical protein
MNSQTKRKMSKPRKRMKSKFKKKMKRLLEFRKRMKRKMMNPQTKRKITPHHSGYFYEPSNLETPSKYEY